ncbi:MAG TPA: NnrS family protein, partial [Thermoanaerobaculia bacterium]|nr:NnrS family protein [Thermoanaerobaculia bacterium]
MHVPIEPARSAPPARPGFALFALGFRPFYLAAGVLAALSVPLWAARFAGWLGEWVYYSESVWHAHEMLFGYAFAVMVGFLFTAVRNWTGRPTPTGAKLAGIVALWLAARVLVFTPWTELAAVADTAFALAAAAGIAGPLFAVGARRNYF